MKSKLNIKTILIIAIIGVLSLVFFNKSFAAVTGTVNVETANIRKTTESDSSIVEQAAQGENVQILEKNEEWYKVKYNGVEGYIRKDLVTVEESTTDLQSSQTNQTTSTKVNETANAEANNTSENKKEETIAATGQENIQANNVAQETKVETATEVQKENAIEGMYTAKEGVKLKIMPLVNGNDIKEIQKDAIVNVLEVCNNWVLAESGLDRGWILYSKIQKVENVVADSAIQVEENKEEENKEEEKQQEEPEEKTTEVAVTQTTMYVNWDVVNLREKPTTSSESLTSLNKATEVTVIAKDGEWSKVQVNDKEGYIKSSLLSETKPEVVTSRSLEGERQPITSNDENTSLEEQYEEPQSAGYSGSGIGAEVCNYAQQFLGCNYVYGGTTPSGFDCSGFTQYVFSNFGVSLNRTAEAQASNGTYVAKSDLQAGDLLIFSHHAGIYLGDGTFIHAANSNSGVIISSLSEGYYVRNYITARRVL